MKKMFILCLTNPLGWLILMCVSFILISSWGFEKVDKGLDYVLDKWEGNT